MNKLFLSLSLILLFSACSNSNKLIVLKEIKKPSWVLDPNQNEKTGAIGISARTHDQKISSQRKIAITRALEELSLQQNVKVKLSRQKNEKLKNEQASVSMDVDSNFQVSANVTEHIEDVWMNDYTNELYIWMVLD